MGKEELEAPILFHLYRRKLWSASYTPKEKSLSKIPKRKRREGKEVISNLIKRGLLIEHKKGSCVSLNTEFKDKIMKILKEKYPDYYF